MSNPIDIASGTNARAVFKELLGKCHIRQFDVHKHNHVRDNVIEPYLLMEQVAGVCSLFYKLRLTNYG